MLLAAIPVRAQSDLPPAKEVVTVSTAVSLDPVPRGRAFEVAAIVKIRPGFHINARQVFNEYLIPTELRINVPHGFRKVGTTYPKGVLRKLRFSPASLNVYEGTVVLRMKLSAESTAPVGLQRLPFELYYQACTDEACLPPVTIPVPAVVQIAPVGARGRAMHRELFPEAPPTTDAPAPPR
jgi:hypothetical protein